MKKNLSVFVLILEIASIGLLHAIKIRETSKTRSEPAAVHFTVLRPGLDLRPITTSLFRIK
jgi:hypothetical protein